MSKKWFETVAEAQRRAEKRLPKSVYSALIAGSERGVTIDDNTAAFGELGFAPHVAGLSATRDLATTVMGQSISMPVVISPTGVQAVHPDGEVAVARAAAARGVAMGLSSFASKPVEEVTAVNPQTFFQMYWVGSREVLLQRMERARKAGAVGLIMTLDWSFSSGRDWGSPAIPEKVDLKAMVRLAPETLVRPRWLLEFAKTGVLPDLTTPNLQAPGGVAPTFFTAYGEWMQTPLPTWEDVAWLREAVGEQVEVLLDGGIRRGSDVVKAVAMGARAVLIGRAYLWGLAANGQAGVENVLDILRGGIDSAVLGLGHSSIHDLTRDDVVIPPGFTRDLGISAAAHL
jgi:L-lactate dehydrogenase (cytochrome)/glycolate oxidase